MAVSESKLQIILKNGPQDIKLDYVELRKIVIILRAVNHDLRKKIIQLLTDNESMNVTTIYVKLRIEQSVASQHLRTLRDAGVVDTKRNGKFIYYTLNHKRLEEVSQFVNKLTVVD